jgi:hypothetical protein
MKPFGQSINSPLKTRRESISGELDVAGVELPLDTLMGSRSANLKAPAQDTT